MSFNIFRNNIRSGKKELDSYIPQWYEQILEMHANNTFAGYTLDRMSEELERLIVNQFIQTCDEDTLGKFEYFLKIKNTSGDFDMRRKKAFAYWNGNRVINRTRIRELNRIFIGCDSEVWFDHVLHIKPSEQNVYFPEELSEILDDQIPSHVPVEFIFDKKIIIQVEYRKFEKLYALPICGTMRIGGRSYISTIGYTIQSSAEIEQTVQNKTEKLNLSGQTKTGTKPAKMSYGLFVRSSTEADQNMIGKTEYLTMPGTMTSGGGKTDEELSITQMIESEVYPDVVSAASVSKKCSPDLKGTSKLIAAVTDQTETGPVISVKESTIRRCGDTTCGTE